MYLLTGDQLAEIVNAIVDGVPPLTAARAVGLSPKDWRTFKTKAAAKEQPYFSYEKEIAKAEARFERAMVSDISKNKDWRAKLTLLEKRYNERYGQKIQIELKDELNKVLDIAQEVLPQEHFLRLLEALSGESGEAAVVDASSAATQLH